MTEKLKLLQYNCIEKGFYSVVGITTQDKICIEGHVCKGILKQLIDTAKKDKAKISKYNKNVLTREVFPKKYHNLTHNKFFARLIQHHKAVATNLEKIKELKYFYPDFHPNAKD